MAGVGDLPVSRHRHRSGRDLARVRPLPILRGGQAGVRGDTEGGAWGAMEIQVTCVVYRSTSSYIRLLGSLSKNCVVHYLGILLFIPYNSYFI